MNINELFESIQDNFIPEYINGEYILHGNVIIWTYDFEDDSEELSIPAADDDDFEFAFESTTTEELLNQACRDDLEQLNAFLDELDELNNWTITEPECIDNTISFKIF